MGSATGSEGFNPADYSSVQMSAQATWSKTYTSVPVQVLGVPREGGLPVKLAAGRATLRHMGGEPTGVRVPGWKPGLDWELLGGGMGPGEWVCTPAPVPGQDEG